MVQDTCPKACPSVGCPVGSTSKHLLLCASEPTKERSKAGKTRKALRFFFGMQKVRNGQVLLVFCGSCSLLVGLYSYNRHVHCWVMWSPRSTNRLRHGRIRPAWGRFDVHRPCTWHLRETLVNSTWKWKSSRSFHFLPHMSNLSMMIMDLSTQSLSWVRSTGGWSMAKNELHHQQKIWLYQASGASKLLNYTPDQASTAGQQGGLETQTHQQKQQSGKPSAPHLSNTKVDPDPFLHHHWNIEIYILQYTYLI